MFLSQSGRPSFTPIQRNWQSYVLVYLANIFQLNIVHYVGSNNEVILNDEPARA
jgi:hypothetical protein